MAFSETKIICILQRGRVLVMWSGYAQALYTVASLPRFFAGAQRYREIRQQRARMQKERY